jgi:hypothetical protein
MKSFSRAIRIIVLGMLIFQISACGGTRAAVNETWSLVEIVTKGDRIDTFTDTVKVQNCGIIQPKTVTCSAGMTNDLTVSLGGEVGVGAGSNFSIDGSVSKGLGIGRESGENVELETPPDGFVYIFTINKEYRVTTGELVAESVSGKQQTANYNFNASCSIQVVSKNQVSCSDINQASSSIDLPGEVWIADIQEIHKFQRYTISDEDFTNFSLESDIKFTDNSPEYHGLMFGLQSNENNFYSFRITPNGSFAFDLWQDSPDTSFTRISGPTNSEAINTGSGQINHLKVVVNGSKFDLFINNQKVGTVIDSTFSSGRVGFVSCTCDGSSSASATFLNSVLFQNP